MSIALNKKGQYMTEAELVKIEIDSGDRYSSAAIYITFKDNSTLRISYPNGHDPNDEIIEFTNWKDGGGWIDFQKK